MQINEDLDGPDFLDAVADAEAAQGNAVNAGTYRARARQWRTQQNALQAAEQRAAELADSLAHIQKIAA